MVEIAGRCVGVERGEFRTHFSRVRMSLRRGDRNACEEKLRPAWDSRASSIGFKRAESVGIQKG
jgi:hypothetical protein